jgi:hypothetical protein
VPEPAVAASLTSESTDAAAFVARARARYDRLVDYVADLVKEETDQKTFDTKEVASIPLTLAEGGAYLEASIDTLPLPANITMQAVFGPGGKEQRFDFAFEDFSTDSAPAALDVATRLMMDIPDSAPDILQMLGERRKEMTDLLGRGGLSELWVPALQGKELALALEFHAREFPAAKQATVAAATRDVVQAAFRLDSAGDRGERDGVLRAAEQFERGVTALEAAFGGKR